MSEKRCLNGFKPEKNDLATMKSFDNFKPKFAVASAANGGEHIIPEFTEISDQGMHPSCVANATCDAAEALIGLRDPSKVVQLSRMAAWWLTRQREGTEASIVGVYLSNVFRVFEYVGVCAEAMWPYEFENALRKPKLAALESCSDNKIAGWVRFFELDEALLDAIDLSLFANHPVVWGTAINKALEHYDGSTGALHPPTNLDDITGRHAMAIFGRRVKAGRREYWVRNSWGKNYGLDGHVWLDQDYLTWEHASNFTAATLAVEII